MTGSGSTLLEMIAGRGARADGLALAVCKLVKAGAELGELEDRQVRGIDGEVRTIKVLPQAWLDRLARAGEVGAFGRMTVDKVVERILLPLSGDAKT